MTIFMDSEEGLENKPIKSLLIISPKSKGPYLNNSYLVYIDTIYDKVFLSSMIMTIIGFIR